MGVCGRAPHYTIVYDMYIRELEPFRTSLQPPHIGHDRADGVGFKLIEFTKKKLKKKNQILDLLDV